MANPENRFQLVSTPTRPHSGEESAKTIQYDIAKLAVLTGNTYDSMIDMVDFFMTDRAGDNDCMLDELQVEREETVKV